MTEVVAALIWEKDRFMICQRPPEKARGLLWEFVGGKVEPGETKPQALVRECREELGVEIAVGDVFMEVVHAYPDLTVHLTLFYAVVVHGTPQKLEHADIRWITPAETGAFAFCPADEEILAAIRSCGTAQAGVQQAVARIRAALFARQDMKYRDFQCGLMPTVARETVIGVRMPQLRACARALRKTPDAAAFQTCLPHGYYEENNLHALFLNAMPGFDACAAETERFLPYVDNWATCDLLRPAALKKDRQRLYAYILRWTASAHTYTVRFGLGMLMDCFLDAENAPAALALAAGVRLTDYYVKMMVAWFFATALTVRYDDALPYILERQLDPWVHNKTIQKAVESYRIPAERKARLRALRLQRPRGAC